MKSSLEKLGDSTLYVLGDLGRMTLFLLRALQGIFKLPSMFSELLRQIHFIGAGYLALNLEEVSIFKGNSTCEVVAEFDNVSGVNKGLLCKLLAFP